MNTSTINWGIIGCGNVTEVKSGPAFNKVANSELVAVMRRDGAKAKDYAQRHGVKKWYDDATALIEDPDVNPIYISTPPLYHESYTMQALQAGKPVYVEKPMAITADAAKRMAAVAATTGVKLCVAHYRRQQPLFLKIKSLLASRIIGDVRLVQLQLLQPANSERIAQTEAFWRVNPAISGGGLFHDLAPHQLDLLLYFFGEPVLSNGVSFNASKQYDADDTISGQILFRDTILFNGIWNFAVPEKRDYCEIIGTHGKLSFSVFDNTPLVITKNDKQEKLVFESLAHVQQPMIEKVVQYFIGNSANPCSGDEGVTVMKMMESFSNKP